MANDLTPKQLSECAGISPSYASLILKGKRGVSSEIALAAFRAHSVRLGVLADMTEDDIQKLCAARSGATCEAEAA